jgi:hypothetical protein
MRGIAQSLFPLLAALGIYAGSAHATEPASSPAGSALESHRSVLTGPQVVQILDDTIDWYRTLGTQQQNATQPSDLLILFANRLTADRVVALAFEIARANAELLSSEANSGKSAADAAAQQSQQQTQLDAQRLSIQAEINAAQQQKLTAAGKPKQDIDAKLIELQGELAMVSARKNLFDTMTDFVSESDPRAAGANALKAQIEAIAATIPAASTNPAAAPPINEASTAASSSASSPNVSGAGAGGGKATADRYGIWDLGADVMRRRKKIDTINAIDQHTAALAETFKKISASPLKQLQAYSAQSDQLAAQADNADSGALKKLRDEFDTLAWLFKQTSEILIPLSKEQVLLQQYRHNLGNWRDASEKQYHEALAALGIRSAILGGILAVVFALGEIWRRGVLLYAHEPHRRYQLMLVRRIVLWTVVIGIVGVSSVTEISTFATFAGLITAGLAVAMQSVLVSVVGYFFLIGKYGIRVGDRIQIGAVVGEVIDLGLVRMHLRELNPQGPLGATGRVVAFANLVVFQASSGLFRQISGANLSWRETTLPLPAVSDYAALKDKLLAAISAAVSEYREEISRQMSDSEKSAAPITADDAAPQIHMHLSNGRMEALLRYPILLKHALEIDERVAKAVLKVIAENA